FTMATFTTRREPLVTCPYNAAHQVKSGRLQIHITKCRKAHPEMDLKPCPYSAEHMVPASEFYHHMHTCPLNTTVERFLTVTETSKPTGDVSVPPYQSGEPVHAEENWDEDVSVAATLEDKIAEPAVTPIFMNVQRMLPAERRHYYASLHSKVDEVVPESMKPRDLGSPASSSLPIPRQPRTEPKIYLSKTPVPTPAGRDSDSDEGSDDDSDDDTNKAALYRMGMGRGCSVARPASTTPSENGTDGLSAGMRLMGLGRGRRVFRD
ncbi:hypothetical protein HPB47_015563, partial [Ixodes persulcatus]